MRMHQHTWLEMHRHWFDSNWATVFAVQDPNECFSTHTKSISLCRPLGELQNVDEDIYEKIFPKHHFSIKEIWIYHCRIKLQYIFGAWMSRISHSIHYHPLFVYSSRAEQNRGSAPGRREEKKRKTEMNGRCCCLTFKSPRHLYY